MNRIFLMMLLSVASSMVYTSGLARTRDNPVYGESEGLTWAVWRDQEADRTFSGAETACKAEIGGVTGWRLPTLPEAMSQSSYKRRVPNGYWDTHWVASFETNHIRSSEAVRASDGKLYHKGMGQYGADAFSDDGSGGGNYGEFACVHDSLLSNKQFTATHKICVMMDCKKQEFSATVYSPPEQGNSPPEQVNSNKDSKSSNSSNTGLVLRADTTAADKAAAAKVLEEANKKAAEESKKEEQANLKRLADEKKAMDDAEARKKAQFRIVTHKTSDYQLTELTFKTWCQEDQQSLREAYSTGRNVLMSVGICSCKVVEHFPPLQPVYGCQYSYTFKEYEIYTK